MKKVLIIQSSLRGFFFNYGRHLKRFEFIRLAKIGTDPRLRSPSSFKGEIFRNKTGGFAKFRRFVGLLNLRPFLSRKGDLVLTYGCLLFTNKPYCVCMENGLAVFNYDPVLSRHPLAKLALCLCILDSHLKILIFLSRAAEKSFFSGVTLPEFVKRQAKSKAVICYPITGRQLSEPVRHKSHSIIRFLFAGNFYMKGGIELINTVEKLNKKYLHKFELTVITQKKLMRKQDIDRIGRIPNINLLEADLTPDQMNNLYAESDVFVYPTYRDSFGLVVLEAVSWSLPVICTGQFAVSEMVVNNKTGFVLPTHPLQDYDAKTYQILGRYYQPVNFYYDLFKFQSQNRFRYVENFLYRSMKKFICDHQVLSQMKKNTTNFYKKNFDYRLSAAKFEKVLSDAITSPGKEIDS